MTTPDERTGSLRETRKFLSELLRREVTPDVPDEIRHQARRLLRHYPGDSQLLLLHRALPQHYGVVVRSER